MNQSGYWVETQFFNRNTGQLLQSCVIYVMIIDRKTRKPVKHGKAKHDLNELIPESLRRTEFPDVFQPEQRPVTPQPYIYTVSVSPSDTDHHQHMGNDGFMKHCLDAASAAAVANHLESFDQTISSYNVKDFAAVYTGEALSGDTMIIACWLKSSTVLYFEVTIKSTVVCRCKVTFHSNRHCNYENRILMDLDHVDNKMASCSRKFMKSKL